MTIPIIIFVVVLVLMLGTFAFVNKSMRNRDVTKVRARLTEKGRKNAIGKGKKKKGEPAAQLFQSDAEAAKGALKWLLKKLNIDQQLSDLVEQAGVTWAPGQVCMACLGLALVTFNIVWYMLPGVQWLVVIATPLAGSLPIVVLQKLRARRTWKFESQFPDALQFISRAMRAGHAFSVSLEMLHKEFPEPLGGEFRRTFEEQNLGLPLDSALEKFGRRMPLMDVQFFIAAVLLQKKTGGNLAEILDGLSNLIRERFKLRGEIKTISAHGRLSSMVLTAIPTVVAIMLYFVHREHMMFFVEDEMGNWMAGLALGFQALGYFIMQQIVKIEV